MSTHTATTRDELRQHVQDLIAQGLSNRAIARRLPVGKDTVSRWRHLAAAAHRGAPADAPPAAPDAPPAPDNATAAPPAHSGAPADTPPLTPDAPPAPDDATPAPPAHTSGAPGPGQLVLDVDANLQAGLALFADAGLTPQQAITMALRFVGDAVADAWDHDVCPRGRLPTMRIQSIHPAAHLGPSRGNPPAPPAAAR